MLLPPHLLLHHHRAERVLAATFNALLTSTVRHPSKQTAMSSSSSNQGFATHAMPSALWAGLSTTALQSTKGAFVSDSFDFRLQQRRMSGYASSSSTSSSSSSSRRPASSRHLPFASISGDPSGTVRPFCYAMCCITGVKGASYVR
jgi:hypothetical protein